MSDDVYFDLGVRLNDFPLKMPLIDQYLDLLREFYTEEQAKLGAEYPQGLFSAKEIAEKFNRDETKIYNLLEEMADNGLMFSDKSGEATRYALTPFVPGVLEFQLMRGTYTPKDYKVAKMLDDFLYGELQDVMKEAMKSQDPEAMAEMASTPPARTLTVEAELPRDTEIYSYEKAREMMEKATSFAAAKCYCRHHGELVDKPCHVEGVVEPSCLSFGKVADYVVDRKFAKRLTKEEALKVLDMTEKAGLVHNVNNSIEGLSFMCNCCGCCCGFLRSVKNYGLQTILTGSNFHVKIDEDTCIGCGDCVDRCQVDALSLDEAKEVAALADNLCLGCGNCVSICPTESLSMVRVSNKVPPTAQEAQVFGT